MTPQPENLKLCIKLYSLSHRANNENEHSDWLSLCNVILELVLFICN